MMNEKWHLGMCKRSSTMIVYMLYMLIDTRAAVWGTPPTSHSDNECKMCTFDTKTCDSIFHIQRLFKSIGLAGMKCSEFNGKFRFDIDTFMDQIHEEKEKKINEICLQTDKWVERHGRRSKNNHRLCVAITCTFVPPPVWISEASK